MSKIRAAVDGGWATKARKRGLSTARQLGATTSAKRSNAASGPSPPAVNAPASARFRTDASGGDWSGSTAWLIRDSAWATARSISRRISSVYAKRSVIPAPPLSDLMVAVLIRMRCPAGG